MRHTLTRKSHKPLQYILLAVAILLLATGLYILLMVKATSLVVPGMAPSYVAAPEQIGDHTIIIPEIGVNVNIASGDQSMLKNGAWHRFPERGDPEKGGNFIVSGHRFIMGWTPTKTKQQSYFYNLDKLEVDDTILIDWNKTRYTYKITKKYTVKPQQVEIEAPSDEAKLTLYTCTLNGSNDGRVVFEAIKQN